ncbi:MAG: collagen-like protein, partial [Gammaproteobacteria bacterium]|nr:collagen-like protein [Gammaproteobacteria bacterium]
MKKLFSIVSVFVLASVMSFAQAPQSFKYQAIARDIEGNIISDKNIGLRISILLGSAGGVIVYSETHNVRSNQFGLINLEIGKGKIESGDMSVISWGTNEHFVKIEIDVSGGEDYFVMGVSQLLSV